MPRHHSRDSINAVLALLDAKKPFAQIHKGTGAPPPTLGRLFSKYCPDHQKAAASRPRKLNPIFTCYAVHLVTNQKSISMHKATKTVSELTGQSLHPKTALRAVIRSCLKPTKEINKPILTVTHMTARRGFAEECKHWEVNGWK
ncbi:hypothetical protein OPQ81_000235 [Rhizoctonia solani]|nr:hypothetical protein OPQ81_000235 [Rhizoctonia solani]